MASMDIDKSLDDFITAKKKSKGAAPKRGGVKKGVSSSFNISFQNKGKAQGIVKKANAGGAKLPYTRVIDPTRREY
jgi:hypothetical protein